MKLILSRHKQILLLSVAFIAFILIFIFLPRILSSHYVEGADTAELLQSTTTPEKVFVPSYVSTPDPVKGIYMTSWVAGTPSLRAPLVRLIDSTELNTVVIDIKDYSGKIVFPIDDNPTLKAYGSEDIRVPDMQDFIESLHKKGIYVIGRIAVFQDAYFVKRSPEIAVENKAGTAVWKDRKGIAWIDPGAEEYWAYIVMLAKESRKIGFDEINFDYIRFPSDGNMDDISYPLSSTTPKTVVLKSFFKYLHDNLADSGLKISADLFGQTTTAPDDMGIGQVLVNALPYFDYVDPMVYPAGYAPGFMNFSDPEAHPYDVVHYAMQSAVQRSENLASTTSSTGSTSSPQGNSRQALHIAELRPWLADFALKQDYGAPEVDAQIKATYDDGLSSWLLWSASNKYTVSALSPEN